MTSKSPVRACEDVDETALSYAEIKALCAGDPAIKEKMDLDIDVARLRLMKADHQSKQYRLEDQILKFFPMKIEQAKDNIAGFQADLATLAAHPLPSEGFVGMEIKGKRYADKEAAGNALIDACKDAGKEGLAVDVGNYRGMDLSLSYQFLGNKFYLTMKGSMSHPLELGTSALGNLIRMENVLEAIPERIAAAQADLDNHMKQLEAAKIEVGKAFPHEQELQTKSARLAELDAALNIDHKTPDVPDQEEDRPSLRDALKAPCRPGNGTRRQHSQEER